ncbi:MAG TPA: triose-phosphate isomerase [Anaerolineales bacterium]
MDRRPMVAGNWKMHKTVAEALALINELEAALAGLSQVDVVIAPPFLALVPLAEHLRQSPIGLAAQNMHWETAGAYTGEVSPVMLTDYCRYVIIGHSERRALFGETDDGVNRKAKSALAHGLDPIVCVGETLEQKEAGKTADVVSRQVRAGLADLDVPASAELILAYEPVWAIGTGLAATADDANDVIEVIIRPAVAHLFGEARASRLRVLYGGSIKPDNAAELFGMPGIDGGLVGGASLKAADFVAIARAAA